MGNSCFCNTNYCIKDIKVNICNEKQSINDITEHILKKEDTIHSKNEKGLTKIKKYFDENEQEIINILNQREKAKKLNKKKRESIASFISNSKYELMLKRLLEQKNIKRNGPKRRETIRKGENIKLLVNEIINENKNEIKKNINLNEQNNLNRNTTLIIKNKINSKMRFSQTIDKKEITNNLNKANKKFYNQNLKNLNTLNEVINEGNMSSGLGKKETNKKD